jgi:hypothetical protein
MTCVIVGLTDQCWIAYFFIDTYFEDMGAETVLEAQYRSHLEQGYRTDPLMGSGNVDADHPIWDSRKYFLTALYHRLQQMKSEWEHLVEEVVKSMDQHERAAHHLLSQQGNAVAANVSQINRESIRHDYNSTQQLILLAAKLKTCLSEINNAYKAGSLDFPKLFEDVQQPTEERRVERITLHAIDKTFRDLHVLEQRLGHLQDRGAQLCGFHERRLTREALQESRGFSWLMMLYVSPVALTTGIFSMQKNFLPFIKPNLGWFMALVVIFSLLSVGVHRCHSRFLRNLSSLKFPRHKLGMSKVCSRRLRWRNPRPPEDEESAVTPSSTRIEQGVGQHTATQSGPIATLSSGASTILTESSECLGMRDRGLNSRDR